MDARSVRVRLSADDVLEELAILGQSDVWNYEVDDRGNVTLAEGVPRRAIRAVSSIKKKVRHLEGGLIEYETEIKLWDKNSALEKAGKHLKLFTEKHEHTGKDGGPLETRLTIVEEIVDAGTDEDDPAAPGPAGVSPE